ncbi:hypothetical protein [Endozoicomonas ascidiicola]|uniref:hypothetical protein n=1 Tax=Endozoicomonas ascidiicola TaxID=1698521 RepID=UPI00082C9D86|nr:hypothetical protein [Endozoicomonas ascidiicola]
MTRRFISTQFLQPLTSLCLIAFLSVFITGCQTSSTALSGLYKEGLPGTAQWSVLPFVSHTNVPEGANIQLERMLVVQLPSYGIKNPEIYTPPESDTLAPLDYASASQWNRENNISFSINGEILEWETDPEGHFSIMMNLRVVDVATGITVWDMNGFGKGRKGEDYYDVSRKLLVDLVKGIPVEKQR